MKDLSTIKTEGLNAEQTEFLALAILAGCKTKADIARLLKATRSMVTQTLQGKTTPEPRTLEMLRMKAAEAAERGKYPQREETVINDPRRADRSAVEALQRELERSIEGWKTILPAPVISWARGGEGSYYEDQGGDVSRIYVPCKDPNCYVLELEGDSMSPTYVEGDLLVVAPNLPPLHNDLVILKTVKEEILFKKLIKKPGSEVLQFHSFNHNHLPVHLRTDEIYRISVVHCVIRPLKERLPAMAISDSGHL